MLLSLRLLPAVAVFAAGFFAVDAWRKHARAHQTKKDLSHDLKTWEGEGGNLPPGSVPINPTAPETSLATSAP